MLSTSICQRHLSPARTFTTYTSHLLLHLDAALQCDAIWINVSRQTIQSLDDPSSKGKLHETFGRTGSYVAQWLLPVSHMHPHVEAFVIVKAGCTC